MKKKKRFYNNKKRGQHWTEKEVGRKIYFADRYAVDNQGSNKFDKGKKNKKPFFTRDNMEKIARTAIVIVCSVLIIGVGYTAMDIHMDLHSMPVSAENNDTPASLKDIPIQIKGVECQPLSLDGGILQEAVIDELGDASRSTVCFDLKRNDGTVGYESMLATVQAYGAISSASSALDKAVKLFNDNDIVPVGRISCYKDNIVPKADLSTAVLSGGGIYTDKAGNTYLSPDSDSAYSYLKGIIEEAMGNGITIFILDNYDLPDDIKGSYNDGFDKLSKKLYKDLGNDIKLLKAEDMSLNSKNSKSIAQEWKEKTQSVDTKDNNIVFCISSKHKAVAKRFLDKKSNINYIIFE